jgi:hypothetical protein
MSPRTIPEFSNNVIFRYCDAFVARLNEFIKEHGDSGKTELNNVVSKHSVTLIPSDKFKYCGIDVEDGQIRLHFGANFLGVNILDTAVGLATALTSAAQPTGAPALSYATRHGIKTYYDPAIGEVLKKIRDTLQNQEFQLEPGFEGLAAKLQGNPDVQDNWEAQLGLMALKYFEMFSWVLTREKFAEDEMLREGFAEGVTKSILKLRIVDDLGGKYNDTLIEDGNLVVQVCSFRHSRVLVMILTRCGRLNLLTGVTMSI